LQLFKSQTRLTLPDSGEFSRAFRGEQVLVHHEQDNIASTCCQLLV
jgi:hypothetical protein